MAFELLDGGLAWEAPVGARAVVALPGSVVVTAGDGAILCLNPSSGKVRWKVEAPVAAPLPAVVEGSAIYVAGEGLAALDLATGKLLWMAPDGTATVGPAVTPDLLVTGEADGTIRCRDRATGAPRWIFATGTRLLAPAIVDAHPRVLVGTTAKAFLALDAEKGHVAWRWKLGADVREPPVVFEDSVLFASHECVLYALNRGNGHLNWKAALPGRPLSGPLVYDKIVLVACFENQVVGFDARSGRPLGILRTVAPLRTAPILVGDKLFAVQRDRSVVARALNLLAAKPLSPAPGKAGKGKAAPRP